MSQPAASPHSQTDTTVVILAAGKGSRMGGSIPKPLQPILGTPIIQHLLRTTIQAGFKQIIVVHHPSMLSVFQNTLPKETLQQITWVEQSELLGTAHALGQALPHIQSKQTLVLLGDTPFVPANILKQMALSKKACTIVSTIIANPYSFGRIIRDSQQKLQSIVEEKDANPTQKNIREINTGIIAAQTTLLKTLVPRITRNEQGKEYYLTQLIALVYQQNPNDLDCITAAHSWQVMGANTINELIKLERQYAQFMAQSFLDQGIAIKDPQRFDCRGTLVCGKNVSIDINVIIEGQVTIGDHCTIGAGCILKNCELADSVHLLPYSMVEGSQIDSHATIGPYAYCRNNTHIGKQAQVGCFVETKSTRLGNHSKAKHLSYLGNLTIADNCNIGAGVIHCNYDGINKHNSTIKSHCFIGADSQIIGPVTIETGAIIAAGATITQNVPENALAITRTAQKNIPGWRKHQPEQQSRIKETSAQD